MPELPEVEVTRRALAPYVEGHTVREVTVREPRMRWPVPADLRARLLGQRVDRLERRGKYLLWRLPAGTLISHLGMSGAWRIHPERAPLPGPHDHVDLRLDAATLRLTDPRRFGALLWQPGSPAQADAHPLLAHLGIEPFDPRFDGAHLHRALRGRRVAIKQALLAGDAVVGVGNIYASESLFRAGIHPARAAGRVSRTRCERLAEAIRTVLAAAIAVGGSTLRDFVSGDGREGYFMADAMVYDRAGQPCRVCGTRIRRLLQGQRATYYCPRCQR